MESLETLGDSFLKYAASQQLFKTYQNHHEGLLSVRKDKIISNAALCKLGCDRKLPVIFSFIPYFKMSFLWYKKYFLGPWAWFLGFDSSSLSLVFLGSSFTYLLYLLDFVYAICFLCLRTTPLSYKLFVYSVGFHS